MSKSDYNFPSMAIRVAYLASALSWCGVVLLIVLSLREDASLLRWRSGLGAAAALCAAMGLFSTAAIVLLRERAESEDWRNDVKRLSNWIESWSDRDVREPSVVRSIPELSGLVKSLDRFRERLSHDLPTQHAPALARSARSASPRRPEQALTRSGMYEPPESVVDPTLSGDFATLDMVSRLDPRTLKWIDSSVGEQQFLGWPLADLRAKSFLDVVHPDDRNLAWEQFQGVLVKGEAHGLIYRIQTAKGESCAIELNVSVRYDAKQKSQVSYIRCHVTDVTDKLRAERELRRRTRELTKVNEELRKTNRELAELKDRYGDLYQNAPAMYFSLDDSGRILECNNTLLRTLGYHREDLIGAPIENLLPFAQRREFAATFADFLRTGYLELETSWKKANGETIDVWVMGTGVLAGDGRLKHSRCVAQDVTARRVLEEELHEKNERLARANEELSRKNKELDEFTYVVSHDLQEPLRTLIAFSDFLMRDCGDRIGEEGREHVRYLVDASRRMRSLINDLLNLSRAGA